MVVLQVLLAFMVGLHNLYWYYGSQTYHDKTTADGRLRHTSEAFQGYVRRCRFALLTFKNSTHSSLVHSLPIHRVTMT